MIAAPTLTTCDVSLMLKGLRESGDEASNSGPIVNIMQSTGNEKYFLNQVVVQDQPCISRREQHLDLYSV